MSYTIINAEKRHEESPETFWIPSKEDRENLKPGDAAKLIFDDGEHQERMWVVVEKLTEEGYVGKLTNNPIIILDVEWNDLIEFEARHIIEIARTGEFEQVEGVEISYIEHNKNSARILH